MSNERPHNFQIQSYLVPNERKKEREKKKKKEIWTVERGKAARGRQAGSRCLFLL